MILRAGIPLALILLILPALPAAAGEQADAVSTTVSVPLHNGDPLTATGTLVVQHRGPQQFLVLQGPTPYRLVGYRQSGSSTSAHKVVQDVAITLPGRDTELAAFNGKTISAKGKLQFVPPLGSWNGALLQATVVVLPGGKELRSKQ